MKTIKTNITIPENKRDKIALLKYPGILSYGVDREGKLEVSHADEATIKIGELQAAITAFEPPETAREKAEKAISALKGKELTQEDYNKITLELARREGIL